MQRHISVESVESDILQVGLQDLSRDDEDNNFFWKNQEVQFGIYEVKVDNLPTWYHEEEGNDPILNEGYGEEDQNDDLSPLI